MSTKSPRVLFLTLDSGDPPLLNRMIAEGGLPNIGRLVRSGISGRVDVSPALGNGVFWPTLHTGVNAGRHGRYYYKQIVPDSYEMRGFREDSDLAYPPFWKHLSDAGARVLVLDAYKAPLVEDLNGVQIADWMTHGFFPHGTPRSWPAGMIEEVSLKYGPDPLGGSGDIYVKSNPDIFDMAEVLVARCRSKTACAVELMRRESWDFALINFAEAHDIGHSGWHMHDHDHPLFDRTQVDRKGDPVEKVYRAFDHAVGELVEAAGAGTLILLVAGTGIENDFSANPLLDRILSLIEKNGHSEQDRTERSGGTELMMAILNRLPSTLRNRRVMKRWRSDLQMRSRAARRCFALPYDEHCGAVRFNLKGREKEGKLAPGEQADTFRRWLTQELLAITYAGTNVPLVKQVIPAGDIFHGERIGHLPDLFVVWSRDRLTWTRDQRWTMVESPAIGRMTIWPTTRTGDHKPDTMFITAGAGILEGRQIADLKAEDIAPTICSLLGAAFPDRDGRTIPELRTLN